MLTSQDGPIFLSLRSMHALRTIKKADLLPKLFPGKAVVMLQKDWRLLGEYLNTPNHTPPEWLQLCEENAAYPLPERITAMVVRDHDSERAIQAALTNQASIILLEGLIKESAKLSYIKSMGSLSLMVEAYRMGFISGVKPMVKIWQKLGFEDILPDSQMLESLWTALDALE